MNSPFASRPHMPGYGTRGPDEGTGLLPWSWAVTRLRMSANYWLATAWPDGRPHVMPVWGVWDQEAFWFSCSRDSRKARNLALDPRCSVATEDAANPVVLEGSGRVNDDGDLLIHFVEQINAKYQTSYGVEFFASAANLVVRVIPRRVFGLESADFTGSPTRWRFGP